MPNKTLPYFLMEKLSVFASIRETRCVPEAEQRKMVVLLRDAIYTTDSMDFYFYNNSFPSGGDSVLSWQSYCIMNDFPSMEVKCPVEGAPGLMCMTKGSLQQRKFGEESPQLQCLICQSQGSNQIYPPQKRDSGQEWRYRKNHHQENGDDVVVDEITRGWYVESRVLGRRRPRFNAETRRNWDRLGRGKERHSCTTSGKPVGERASRREESS